MRPAGGPDAACRLEADLAVRLLDHREQHRCGLEGGADLCLAGRGLQEITAGHHRGARRARDQRRVAQHAGLEDHLERPSPGADRQASRARSPCRCRPRGSPRSALPRRPRRRPRRSRGAFLGGPCDVVAAVREVGDGREPHARAAQQVLGQRHEAGPDADRRRAGWRRAGTAARCRPRRRPRSGW